MSPTVRFGSRVVLAALVVCAGSIGCSKAAPPAPVAPSTPAAAAFSRTSARIEIGRFGVNEPRADGTACWTARYTLAVADRTLHVETCVDDNPSERDVTLSDDDMRTIQSSLDALRETAAATASCDSKSGAYLVQIQDQSRNVAQFTDSTNTCHAGDMKILDRTSVEALFSTIELIAPTGRS